MYTLFVLLTVVVRLYSAKPLGATPFMGWSGYNYFVQQAGQGTGPDDVACSSNSRKEGKYYLYHVSYVEPNDCLKLTRILMWMPRLTGAPWAEEYNETTVRTTVDSMVASGLVELGFNMILLDDCWLAAERDKEGKLSWNNKTFPSGIR